jgi:hypothetical protein
VPRSVPTTSTEVITLGVDTHKEGRPRRLNPGWSGQTPWYSERTYDPGGLQRARGLGERVRSSRACRGGGHGLLRSRAYPLLEGALAAVFGVEPSYLVDRKAPPLLDVELFEGLADKTTREIIREVLHLPEKERKLVLGIVRQFGCAARASDKP